MKKVPLTTTLTEEDKTWDELVIQHGTPGHYMQGSAWGKAKSHSQWPASRFVAETKTGTIPVQVYSRMVPGLGRLLYAPEVTGVSVDTIPDLTTAIRKECPTGLAFKLDLYQPYSEELIAAFEANGWQRAWKSVQHRSTVIVDLSGTEEELFARLKKRARYEIRAAMKGEVRVEEVAVTDENFKLLDDLLAVTAKRTGGFFRSDAYTKRYVHAFSQNKQGRLFYAWHGEDLLAGAYVITMGKAAWYKDGGSVRNKSELMGPRMLQWEIMRQLQADGITSYDLCGIPPEDQLDTHPLKGLYAFKTGFSKEKVRFVPAMELPLSPKYKLWPKVERHLLRAYSGIRKDFWY